MTRAGILQSALDPSGPQAEHIARLWWLMFWVAAAVFVLVVGFGVAAAIRGRRKAPVDDVQAERHLTIGVVSATVVTILTLFVLLFASVRTGRAIESLAAADFSQTGTVAQPASAGGPPPRYRAVTVEVTGHQFWWEVQYDDGNPSARVRTANEIHIPLHRPVVLKVTSRDVIHSFWAPNLHGKRDLIPGYVTAIWLRADEPAVYRGQCAEFCGRQHAHMAFEIVAEDEGQFEQWLDAQRSGSAAPQSAQAIQGRDVFMRSQCVLCHTIAGTSAQGLVGPDLTHVASRGKIAAGTLPNTRGHLGGWVADPQQIKPGSQMPPTALNGPDLQALLSYLETLK